MVIMVGHHLACTNISRIIRNLLSFSIVYLQPNRNYSFFSFRLTRVKFRFARRIIFLLNYSWFFNNPGSVREHLISITRRIVNLLTAILHLFLVVYRERRTVNRSYSSTYGSLHVTCSLTGQSRERACEMRTDISCQFIPSPNPPKLDRFPLTDPDRIPSVIGTFTLLSPSVIGIGFTFPLIFVQFCRSDSLSIPRW